MSKLSEAVVNQVVALLQANLPAQLGALSAEMGDGITLENPVEYLIGERLVTRWPAVRVLCPDATPELDENKNQFSGQYPLGRFTHRIEIVIEALDSTDPDRLRRKLYRYARAITEIVKAHEGYTADVADWSRARTVGHSFKRAFVEEDRFRQDAFVLLDVSRAD